uniref:Uncharacterized protein n=1 Tax=Romanomermis culicivorax TaxID=13658 RepID=A0A915L1E7_ROMCU
MIGNEDRLAAALKNEGHKPSKIRIADYELHALIRSKCQPSTTPSNRLKRFTSKGGGVLWDNLAYL